MWNTGENFYLQFATWYWKSPLCYWASPNTCHVYRHGVRVWKREKKLSRKGRYFGFNFTNSGITPVSKTMLIGRHL